MPYTTKQQQAVLRCLELRKEESLTAADLAEDLRQMGCPVGLATIYRQLEKLSAAGQIHKINTAEGAFYQLCGHTEQDHRDCFLLKCSRCGRIRHLDCSHLQALYDHLCAIFQAPEPLPQPEKPAKAARPRQRRRRKKITAE